ncbi:MAG: hypothetical protein P4L41_00180 [Flavipsychrobacter sp.]|nr:hypothetical protein [Flavipsychrobacter sp.]
MSYASILDRNKVLDLGNIDSTNVVSSNLQVTNGTHTVSHTVDASGNYNVTNQNNLKLLQFDSNANLIDGVLSQAIVTNTDEITVVANNLSTLDTTLSNLQSEVQGILTTVNNMQNSGNGPQGLNSVLAIGHYAGGQNISSVGALGASSVSIGAVNLTTDGNSHLIISNDVVANIQANQILLGGVDLNTRITAIETYLQGLSNFFQSFRNQVNLKDINNGNADYNYSSLTFGN